MVFKLCRCHCVCSAVVFQLNFLCKQEQALKQEPSFNYGGGGGGDEFCNLVVTFGKFLLNIYVYITH
jgi:hypothetical protein